MNDGWVSKGWSRAFGVTPGRWLVLLGLAGAVTAGCGEAKQNADATDADANASSAGGSTSSVTGGGTSSVTGGGVSSVTGGDASSSTGGAPSVDIATVFEFMAADVCQDDCSGSGALLEQSYNLDCLYLYGPVYDELQASAERSIETGTVSFDAAQAQACLDDLAQTGCDDPPSAACLAMFVGHIPEQGACFDSRECADDGYCDRELGCPGVCEPRLSAGALCDEGGACALGLSCSPEGVCDLPRPNGEACAEHADCLSEYCNDDDVCAERVHLSAAEGQPCARLNDCQLGLYCSEDLAEPVCVPASKLGEACTDISLGLSCADAAFCDVETGSVEGMCAERLPLGAPCEVSEQCATMVCDSGTCQELSRVGEPCVTDLRCVGVCEGEVCAPLPECRARSGE